MSAMGGGGAANVQAFAAALDAATRRLDALADTTERTVSTKERETKASKQSLDALKSVAMGVAGFAFHVASGTMGASLRAGSFEGVGGSAQTAFHRAFQYVPMVGAPSEQVVQAYDQTSARMMDVLGPLAAAGGRVTPDLMQALFNIEAPRVKRMQQAGIQLEGFLNASEQREVLERGTGISAVKDPSAWEGLYREYRPGAATLAVGEAAIQAVSKSVRDLLDGLGFGSQR